MSEPRRLSASDRKVVDLLMVQSPQEINELGERLGVTATAVRQRLGRLMSMDYVEHNEGVTVTEILLSGGGVLAPGAAEYIEQSVARPTRLWNPLEGLRVDVDRLDVEELEAWAPSLVVVAVGLASRVRT